MSSSEAKLLYTTQEGSIVLSKCREGRILYEKTSAQMTIAELTAVTYGLVVCKYDSEALPPVDPVAGHLFSLVLDEQFKFACEERALTVDFYVYDQGVGDWATHYHLTFDQLVDWHNVVRLLNEAKYKHILRGLHLHFTLDAVLARGFSAEEGSDSSFESARTTAA